MKINERAVEFDVLENDDIRFKSPIDIKEGELLRLRFLHTFTDRGAVEELSISKVLKPKRNRVSKPKISTKKIVEHAEMLSGCRKKLWSKN